LGTLLLVPGSAARAQDDQAAVEVHDNYYSPAEIHVVEGGTVTWTDLGGAHSVTSDAGETFDSNPSCVAGLNCMANGDTFSHQFRAPGTVTYLCHVHGNAMVGKVIVDPASTTTSETSSSTTTTLATTTSTDNASAAPSSDSDQTTISQYPLPSLPSEQRSVALPRAVARSARADDMRPWALLAIAIAAGTTIAGIVLVRRGRVPFG
jgi:plastocyanin